MKCLDHNDLNNYRPVSSLCLTAKILEKLVLSRVSSYLNSHNLYNTCQSAYRPGQGTETALLKVVNHLFLSLSKGKISVLALLDFSSAFDTIDHRILVHRLHTDFGFTDTVLQWFSSYLTDRTHYVSLSNHCSAFAPVHSGVSHIPKKPSRKVYQFHKADKISLKMKAKAVLDKFIKSDPTKNDINTNWCTIKSILNNLLNDYVPYKTTKSRHNLPWITNEIKHFMRKRDRLFH